MPDVGTGTLESEVRSRPPGRFKDHLEIRFDIVAAPRVEGRQARKLDAKKKSDAAQQRPRPKARAEAPAASDRDVFSVKPPAPSVEPPRAPEPVAPPAPAGPAVSSDLARNAQAPPASDPDPPPVGPTPEAHADGDASGDDVRPWWAQMAHDMAPRVGRFAGQAVKVGLRGFRFGRLAGGPVAFVVGVGVELAIYHAIERATGQQGLDLGDVVERFVERGLDKVSGGRRPRLARPKVAQGRRALLPPAGAPPKLPKSQKSPPTRAPKKVTANSKQSKAVNYVYEIYAIDRFTGERTTFKYGITGQANRNRRPTLQVLRLQRKRTAAMPDEEKARNDAYDKLVAEAKAKGQEKPAWKAEAPTNPRFVFRYRWVSGPLTRQQALVEEKRLVTEHMLRGDNFMPGQMRPYPHNPAQFGHGR
jgi:hypothetical protein